MITYKNNIRAIKVKVIDRHGVLHTYLKMSGRRFSSIFRHAKCKNFDVKVTYQPTLMKDGEIRTSENWGTYTNFNDALYMLKAFLEK